jgi:hypothetical protein
MIWVADDKERNTKQLEMDVEFYGSRNSEEEKIIEYQVSLGKFESG